MCAFLDLIQLDAIQNNFTTDQNSESPLNYNSLYFIEKQDDLGEVLKELREKPIHKINQDFRQLGFGRS